MSAAESVRGMSVELECGNCGQVNLPEAKFCGGCGHALFEPCEGCEHPVRLSQRFCESCGKDLEASLIKRRQQLEKILVDALNDTKQHDYEHALGRLARIESDSDYRVADLVGQAKAATAKVRQLRNLTYTKTQAVLNAVKGAVERDDKPEIVRLLTSVPETLLDAEAKKLLAKNRSYLGELQTLHADVKTAIADKDWPTVGSLLERWMQLCPEDATLATLAKQVGAKLIGEFSQLYARHEYVSALERLDAIPSMCHDGAYQDARQRAETASWLSDQFAVEPFATPTLGRLAVRLSKHAPENPMGQELVNRLSARLKEAPPNPRQPYPVWSGSRHSHLGGEAAIIGWPQSINCKGDATLRRLPGRFSIAYGLALQGLGVAKIDVRLGEKKSLLAGLGSRRRPKVCWGVDLGNSSLKAVLLQRDEKETVAIDAFAADYPPSSRLGTERRGLIAARDALKQFVEAKSAANVDIWVNYSGRDLLSRFIELPPVEDKKALALLNAEVTGQFPVNVEELDLIKWVADKPTVGGIGRPAALIAARKVLVEQRLDFLKECGLKVAGLQCEPIALANFIYHELPDEMKRDEKSRTNSALAVVDVGAVSTTLLIVDSEGFWFRAVEGGSEESTGAISRSAKVVADEAEKLKRDPSTLAVPLEQYRAVEEKQEATASRLRQLKADALKNRRDLQIAQTWVVGGGCFSLGWIRRVVCS